MNERAPCAALCRHFGVCGGCAFQDLGPQPYRELKVRLVVDALAEHGIHHVPRPDLIAVPPRSRRRATLKVLKTPEGTRIGFHALRSHEIVDMRECLVLTPGLFMATQP